MCNTKRADSKPVRGARRARGPGPEFDRAGKGRWLGQAHDERGAGAAPRRRPGDNEPQARCYGSDSFASGARPSCGRRGGGPKFGSRIGSTGSAAVRGKSSPIRQWRTSCCAGTPGARRRRRDISGGGRGDEPCPVDLHLHAAAGACWVLPARGRPRSLFDQRRRWHASPCLVPAPGAAEAARHRWTAPRGDPPHASGLSIPRRGPLQSGGAAAAGRRSRLLAARAAPDAPAPAAGAAVPA